jgi:taurine dioxygenase
VLVFRDQRLRPEQHLALAKALGVIDANRFFRPVDGHPEIAAVGKEAESSGDVGGGWGADDSYDQIPAEASIFYARELSRDGGDTLFACAARAYDALSPGLRATLAGLRVLHSNQHAFGYDGDAPGRIVRDLATQDAIHPAVFKHPLTGRRALYVNPVFTVRFEGWTASESAPLLNLLYEEIARDAFVFRLVWREGTLAIWDNRMTWNKSDSEDQGERRLMHRITLAGRPLQTFDLETG